MNVSPSERLGNRHNYLLPLADLLRKIHPLEMYYAEIRVRSLDLLRATIRLRRRRALVFDRNERALLSAVVAVWATIFLFALF